MGGFLRRLAAQAMGIANPVRTTANSPFAGAPALVEDPAPLAAGPSPVVVASGTRVEHGTTGLARADSLTAKLGGRRDARADPVIERKVEPPPTDSGSAAAAVDARGVSINTPVMEKSSPASDRREASAVSFVVKERDAHVGVERARELDVELPAPARPASPVSTNRGPAELLLPPQARSAPKGLFERERHGSERWPTANRSSSVEETTEVHVSIGRIEVTAVHEAAPQKSGGPRRPAPMSLDQYLAKRRSGRP